MKSIRTMRFAVFLIFLGLSTNGLVQGARRVLKIRKTGEFGRRIAPISQLYEPPRRFSVLDPFLQASETQNSVSLGGIQKPSQKLELPSFSLPEHPDSVGAETGESSQGYTYPDPDSEGGYDYEPIKVKHPAIAEYPENDPPEDNPVEDAPPEDVVPQVEAEFPSQAKPFGAESEQQVDAGEQSPVPQAPKSVSDRPSAELDNQAQAQTHDSGSACSEHDHDCWPHGYAGVIHGEAGTDYPILREIVSTPFDCENVQYSGYYADTDSVARCQIFHVCLKGNAYRRTQKWSFLCPNGTVFSQGDLVCVWWDSAPECNAGVVDELALRNAELGWDNLTETETRSTSGNFDVNSAMNSLRNGNLQASGSDPRTNSANPFPTTTTRRPPPTQSRSAIPYRVPIKVNARTQLKEVAGNGLQGESAGENNEAEYTGEETEAYETSLSQQSESRHRSKTASTLSQSESEAYEQKSVPESVSPLIVNRPPSDGANSQDLNVVQQGEFSEEEGLPDVVMMPTQGRNPDGSEAYAEVPVMMNSAAGGYHYPAPTSQPDLSYLPPRKEFVPRSTTTEVPNTTTFVPVTEESIDAVEEQYQQYSNTERSAPIVETTIQSGYRYPVPTTTEQSGYNYPVPTTTQAPYQEEVEEVNSQAPDIEYAAYESSTFAPDTTTTPTVPTTTTTKATTTTTKATKATTTTQKVDPTVAYLPPPSTIQQGGYDLPTTSIRSNAADVLPATTTTDNTAGDDLFNSKLAVTSNPLGEDYTHAVDISTITSGGGNSVSESSEQTETGGYSDKSTVAYTIPTPSSNIGGPINGDNLDTTQDEKVNKILQEIKNGGAEVRDENGNTLNFEDLKKLILSTPNGLLSLQKADDSDTTESSSSSSTELPATTSLGQEEELEDEVQDTEPATVEEKPKGPVLEDVQAIEDTPSHPSTRYLPASQLQSVPQQSYFSNNRLVSIKHPGFEISAPSKEYESHLVQKNTVVEPQTNQNLNNDAYSGFASFQPERQVHTAPTDNYVDRGVETPTRNEYDQNFPTRQNTQSPQVYYQQSKQPTQQQHQFRVQQSQQAPPAPEVNFLRPSVPQPNLYYQTQPQPSTSPTRQLNSDTEISYFQQTPQLPPTVSSQFRFPDEPRTQSQYFQQKPTSEYLPPPISTPTQSQYYSPSPTQYRNSAPSTPTRDLTNNIQLQQSYSFPLPQASTNIRNLANPLDIKIVPALLVNTHTRVEQGHKESGGDRNFVSNANYPQFSEQQRNVNNANNNANQYLTQYSSQSENRPVKVRAPRLNPFTLEDALPKREKFTPEESRNSEQVTQYRPATITKPISTPSSLPSTRPPSPNLRHFGGDGGRVNLGLPSETNSLTNFYPGRDNSLGVKLTYN